MTEPYWSDGERTIYHGDCLTVLPSLPDASVDFVFTDPPYPEISRPYGRWTEAEWRTIMDAVVNEYRRLLKPTGSAMFVLQPNSEKVGRMRSWLWEFMAYWSREWNQVQDLWWWNVRCLPLGGTTEEAGMSRPSLKAIVWLGDPECYRNRAAVAWELSYRTATNKLADRAIRVAPSGRSTDTATMYDKCRARGDVSPFNVWPISGVCNDSVGHPAQTPVELVDRMVAYACPPGGIVLDPFFGAGTTGVACKETGRRCIGIEKEADYCASSVKRIEAAKAPERTLFAAAAGM